MSADLRRLCSSADALTRVCPASSEAVRLLLSVVAHAPDLRSIGRLRSMGIQPTNSALGRVAIGHKEVEMHAVVLTNSGRVLHSHSAGDFWVQASVQSALRVDDVYTSGISLLRDVS